MNQILKRQTSRFHYGSKVLAVTITAEALTILGAWCSLGLIVHLLCIAFYILYCKRTSCVNIVGWSMLPFSRIIVGKTHLHSLIICKYIIYKQTHITTNCRSKETFLNPKWTKKTWSSKFDWIILCWEITRYKLYFRT